MEEKDNPKEFPDVSTKLSAPKKLSAFEKERQAAQAKQQRAEAENAAALRAFENSFASDDGREDSYQHNYGGRGPPAGPRGYGFGHGSGRPGTGSGGPRSGPGSLGPIPGPPPSLKRKRALDEMREAQEARREQEEMMAYAEAQAASRGSPYAESREDDGDVDAPRPTVQLSSLPPDMSSEEVRMCLSEHLKVHSVRFQPPAGPGNRGRRTASAIATLAADVSTSQIDTAITALKDKYLGRGFYLSISRHLSSAAFHPSVGLSSTASTEPFAAEKPRDQRFSMRNAPPPMDQRGFAPPDSYDNSGRMRQPGSNRENAVVSVQPPGDMEAVKAIHTVAESLLLESDPNRALQKEALLMSLPEVQRDERFAFLYDSQSPAGIYYRFLLWSPDDIDEAAKDAKRRDLEIERLHEDVPIEWHPPYSQVPFPDLKSLEQVVTDIDYVSSEEESDDEEDRHFNAGDRGIDKRAEKKHLTPLKRARLVHLLSRLPTSNARLRKGDVARVTNFAINHAGAGAEEIVDLLLLNVMKPFQYSLAAKYEDAEEQAEDDVYEPDDELATLDSPAAQVQTENKRDDDHSNARLIGLYLISDILSASSTAGARNAWKYRQLFESGFKAQKTFEYLGKLDKELSMGRLKAEQWKRKIGVIFGIWEGWSVFSSDVHEELKTSFFEPPLSEEEKAAAQAEAEREEKKQQEAKILGKFKRVESVAASPASASPAPVADAAEEVEGAPLDDLDGARAGEDLDGAPMEDLDGAPMEDLDGQALGGLVGTAEPVAAEQEHPSSEPRSNGKPSAPRKRMRAEDMFADSDED